MHCCYFIQAGWTTLKSMMACEIECCCKLIWPKRQARTSRTELWISTGLVWFPSTIRNLGIKWALYQKLLPSRSKNSAHPSSICSWLGKHLPSRLYIVLLTSCLNTKIFELVKYLLRRHCFVTLGSRLPYCAGGRPSSTTANSWPHIYHIDISLLPCCLSQRNIRYTLWSYFYRRKVWPAYRKLQKSVDHVPGTNIR